MTQLTQPIVGNVSVTVWMTGVDSAVGTDAGDGAPTETDAAV